MCSSRHHLPAACASSYVILYLRILGGRIPFCLSGRYIGKQAEKSHLQFFLITTRLYKGLTG